MGGGFFSLLTASADLRSKLSVSQSPSGKFSKVIDYLTDQ